MHLFRTRAYVPAKRFWGALTAKLTPQLQLTEYVKVGNFLKETMRFGYLYLSDGNEVFVPHYTEEGLKFGNLPQIDFEKKFISCLASTAVESCSFTADEGMLHEVEFISPHTINGGNPVFCKGLLWVSEFSKEGLSIVLEDDGFFIKHNNVGVKLSELMDIIQLGGEKKYGFGQLKLETLEEIDSDDLEGLGFTGQWKEDENEVELRLDNGKPIWSHAKQAPDLKIKGNVEPLVGRDWSEKGAGRELKPYGLCWIPGSILMEGKAFKITQDFGLWK